MLGLDETNSRMKESVLVAKGFGSDGGQPFARLEEMVMMFLSLFDMSLFPPLHHLSFCFIVIEKEIFMSIFEC